MTDRPMRSVDHTNPFNDRSFGDAFARGPIVVTDGSGEPVEKPKEEMRDVDHEPPGDGANSVFERGGETDDEDEDAV